MYIYVYICIYVYIFTFIYLYNIIYNLSKFPEKSKVGRVWKNRSVRHETQEHKRLINIRLIEHIKLIEYL